MGNINVDYYYDVETKEFKELSFYCIPKFLITDERFRYLSNDAKMLYVLMLDKMSFSIKNCWIDEMNRLYIIYPTKDIMCDIKCQRNKCAKLLAELSKVGLIERHKRGLGKPDIIYVKGFDLEDINSN